MPPAPPADAAAATQPEAEKSPFDLPPKLQTWVDVVKRTEASSQPAATQPSELPATQVDATQSGGGMDVEEDAQPTGATQGPTEESLTPEERSALELAQRVVARRAGADQGVSKYIDKMLGKEKPPPAISPTNALNMAGRHLAKVKDAVKAQTAKVADAKKTLEAEEKELKTTLEAEKKAEEVYQKAVEQLNAGLEGGPAVPVPASQPAKAAAQAEEDGTLRDKLAAVQEALLQAPFGLVKDADAKFQAYAATAGEKAVAKENWLWMEAVREVMGNLMAEVPPAKKAKLKKSG